MKIPASRLLRLEHGCYYLSGEDRDALYEAAEALLSAGDGQAIRLRLDVSELARFEEESRNQGLFGTTACYALIRNAEAATPKQTTHSLQLAASVTEPNRLIICAPGISNKKALHKKMQALSSVAHCEFRQPDVQAFQQWLQEELQQKGLRIDEQVLPMVAEQLCGMRMAARQWMERLQLYDGGKGEELKQSVVTALLGERAPDDLAIWVHAVAMKDKAAVRLMQRLLRDQKVSEVQMHSWLNTRFQQLLMYRWYQSRNHRNPLQAAKVFTDAKRKVPQEAKHWQGADLIKAVALLQDTEKQLKGASVEDKAVVMERLVLTLLGGQNAVS